MIRNKKKKRIEYSELRSIVSKFPEKNVTRKYKDNISCVDVERSGDEHKDKKAYDIEIKNLEINFEVEEKSTATGVRTYQHDIDLSTDSCTITFKNNRFNCTKGGTKSRYHRWQRILSWKIEFIDNTLVDAMLYLQGSYISLVGNKEIGNNRDEREGIISVASSSYGNNDSTDEILECTVFHNKFNRLWASGKGRLDMFAKNYIHRWYIKMDEDECKEFEWFIGPKLYIHYPKGELYYLQQVRRGFMVLLRNSIERKDRWQQKFIQSEISRLDFHIFRETARTWGDHFDMIPRYFVYFFKLQFADRILFVKSLLWAIAFLMVVSPLLVAIGLIVEWEFWDTALDWINTKREADTAG